MGKYRWIVAAALVLAFLYLTRAILLPFIAGLAVAYLLDPLVDRLEARKIPRGLATAVVLAVFFALFVGIILAIWPILQSQLAALARSLPNALLSLRGWLDTQFTELTGLFGGAGAGDVDSMLAGLSAKAFSQLERLAANLVAGGVAVFNIITLGLITPVVAFYLLRDWDIMIARIGRLLPAAQAGTIAMLAGRIDDVLAGFVRGQILVCLVMALLYAAGWTVVGLQYGLILGLIAGILAFIPFVGPLVAVLLALILAVSQWGLDPLQIGLVTAVYLAVQVVEGAFLTPRLVGERVGLHAVWVLFAVFAGGELMGFVGVLVAVPVAAAIAVLVRHMADGYVAGQMTAPAGGEVQDT